MVLLLKEADVRAVLTMDIALEAVEEAFHGLADGSAINYSRRRLALDKGGAHYMGRAARAIPHAAGRCNSSSRCTTPPPAACWLSSKATGWARRAPARPAAWRR